MPFEFHVQKTLVYIIYCQHDLNTLRTSICHLKCLKLGNLKVLCTKLFIVITECCLVKLDALNITKLCFADQYFSIVFHHSESCEMFPSILHSKEYIGICLNKKKQ